MRNSKCPSYEVLYAAYWTNKNTVVQIAKQYDTNHRTVLNWMHRLNIPIRSRTEAHRLQFHTNHISDEQLKVLYAEGYSQDEIAKMVSVTQGTIKNRLAHIGVQARTKANIGSKNGMYGRTHTPEARAKIRAANKRQWSKPGAREAHALLTIKQFQSGKTGKANNKLEQRIATVLTNEGITYQPQFRVGRFLFDFYLPAYHLLLEVHGRYWHADPRFYADRKLNKTQQRNMANDVKKQRRALKGHYLFLALWEDDIRSPKFSIIPWLPAQLPLFA